MATEATKRATRARKQAPQSPKSDDREAPGMETPASEQGKRPTLENGSDAHRELLEALHEYRDAVVAVQGANEAHQQARARLVGALEALGLKGYVP